MGSSLVSAWCLLVVVVAMRYAIVAFICSSFWDCSPCHVTYLCHCLLHIVLVQSTRVCIQYAIDTPINILHNKYVSKYMSSYNGVRSNLVLRSPRAMPIFRGELMSERLEASGIGKQMLILRRLCGGPQSIFWSHQARNFLVQE